jgi:Fe2+ transport system protein FeoA
MESIFLEPPTATFAIKTSFEVGFKPIFFCYITTVFLTTIDNAGVAYMTLDDLRVGERGRIIRLNATGPFKKRLLEMGFVQGVEVKVVKYAPLLDPVEYCIKGYHVSLRHDEARLIEVESLTGACSCDGFKRRRYRGEEHC